MSFALKLQFDGWWILGRAVVHRLVVPDSPDGSRKAAPNSTADSRSDPLFFAFRDKRPTSCHRRTNARQLPSGGERFLEETAGSKADDADARAIPWTASACRRSAVLVPPGIRHPADQSVAYGLYRNHGQGTRSGSVDAHGADVLGAVLAVHVHDEDHRIVLGGVAGAIDWVLAELRVRRRVDAVCSIVPGRRRIRDDVPTRVAAKVSALTQHRDNPDVANRVIVVQREPGRQGDIHRRLEELAFPFDADHDYRIPGVIAPPAVPEESPPDGGGPLPFLEVCHAHFGAGKVIPPCVRKREAGVNEGLPDFPFGFRRRTEEPRVGGHPDNRSRARGNADHDSCLHPLSPSPTRVRLRFRQASSLRPASPSREFGRPRSVARTSICS